MKRESTNEVVSSIDKQVALKYQLAAFLLLFFQITAFAGSGSLLPPKDVISSITKQELKRHLNFLASDELGGRYSFSSSNHIAARYLASHLEAYGFRGAARDGSYFQKVPFVTLNIADKFNRAALVVGNEEQKLNYPEDFIFYNTGERTTLKLAGDNLRAKFSGSLVFVGYGISSPRNNYDDYAGLDVKGKIVVRVDNRPTALNNAKLEATEYRDGAAKAHGAIAAIVISTRIQKMWTNFRDTLLNEKEMRPRPRPDILARKWQEESDPAIPEILAGPRLVQALTSLMRESENYLNEAEGYTLRPRNLDASIQIDTGFTLSEAPPTYNVVGIFDGADPKLKNEYVVLSAHYDHLEDSQKRGDVYNGADDNASGVATILEIADALAQGKRPKRSIMIVFYTAEELGLYGSQFNTDYDPLVPLSNIAANFNLDMVGRSAKKGDTYKHPPFGDKTTDENSVYIITNDSQFKELKNIHEEINAKTVRLQSDYTYSNLKHPSRLYYRTDSYNYAKSNIPFITYFTGWHQDYHKPTDEINKIDFSKMERITRLAFATSWHFANSDFSLLRKN